MTTPHRDHSSRLKRVQPRHGNSPPSDIAPYGHADGGPFFHPASHANDEAGSGTINQTEFSSSPVKRADSLMNFAEAILTGAILADRASQNLLHRVEHLNASVRAKYGPSTEQMNAKELQG